MVVLLRDLQHRIILKKQDQDLHQPPELGRPMPRTRLGDCSVRREHQSALWQVNQKSPTVLQNYFIPGFTVHLMLSACFDFATDYQPCLVLCVAGMSEQPDVLSCQCKCQEDTDCQHFTYAGLTGVCTLKKSQGVKTPTLPTVTSGPKNC